MTTILLAGFVPFSAPWSLRLGLVELLLGALLGSAGEVGL